MYAVIRTSYKFYCFSEYFKCSGIIHFDSVSVLCMSTMTLSEIFLNFRKFNWFESIVESQHFICFYNKKDCKRLCYNPHLAKSASYWAWSISWEVNNITYTLIIRINAPTIKVFYVTNILFQQVYHPQMSIFPIGWIKWIILRHLTIATVPLGACPKSDVWKSGKPSNCN